MKSTFIVSFLMFTLLITVTEGTCQNEKDRESDSNPLSSFESLIGGEWHQQGGFQIFRWGVGKKSVQAENYFMMNGEAQKVSEGVWFWHPGEQQIKGFFTATNMPVEFFDYNTRFTKTGLESDLEAYDAAGNLTRFTETWEFETENKIRWTLYSLESDMKTEVMSGIMNRK